MDIVKWINFNVMGDERGKLTAIESLQDVPFEIKRIYYLYETLEGVPRGFHAHRELKQVAVCLTGSCKMLISDGVSTQSVQLDTPGKGIIIDNMVWHEMYDFSNDCVLLVIADDYYNEDDYIRDKAEFLRIVSDEKNTPAS